MTTLDFARRFSLHITKICLFSLIAGSLGLYPDSANAKAIDFLRLLSLLRQSACEPGKVYDLQDIAPYQITKDFGSFHTASIVRSLSMSPDSRYLAFFAYRGFNEIDYRQSEQHKVGDQTLFVVEPLDENLVRIITKTDLKPHPETMSFGPNTVEFVDSEWLRISWDGLSKADLIEDADRDRIEDLMVGDNYDFYNIKTEKWMAFPGTKAHSFDSVSIHALAPDLYLLVNLNFGTYTAAAFYQFNPRNPEARVLGPLQATKWPIQAYLVRRVQKTTQNSYLLELSIFGKEYLNAPNDSWHRRWFELYPNGRLVTFTNAQEFEHQLEPQGLKKTLPAPYLIPANKSFVSFQRMKDLSNMRQIEWTGAFQGENLEGDSDFPSGKLLKMTVALMEAGFKKEELPDDLDQLSILYARLQNLRAHEMPLFTLKKSQDQGFYLFNETWQKIDRFLPIPQSWDKLKFSVESGILNVENPLTHESLSFPLKMLKLHPKPRNNEISCETALKSQ